MAVCTFNSDYLFLFIPWYLELFLIVIKYIQIKVFVCIIYVCVCYVCLLCIYKYTHMHIYI